MTLKVGSVCPDCMYIDLAVNQTFLVGFVYFGHGHVTRRKFSLGLLGPKLARQALFTWERANLIHSTYIRLRNQDINSDMHLPMVIRVLSRLLIQKTNKLDHTRYLFIFLQKDFYSLR